MELGYTGRAEPGGGAAPDGACRDEWSEVAVVRPDGITPTASTTERYPPPPVQAVDFRGTYWRLPRLG